VTYLNKSTTSQTEATNYPTKSSNYTANQIKWMAKLFITNSMCIIIP